MLDRGLAGLYGVETKQLTRQVRRTPERFREDFAFQLTQIELDALAADSGSAGRGGRRHMPWAFTEEGVAMLSSVLRSPQAIEVNVQIMRAFVQLRELLSSENEFRGKLAALEARLTGHDAHFRLVFDAIRQLMTPPGDRSKKRIGFRRNLEAG